MLAHTQEADSVLDSYCDTTDAQVADSVVVSFCARCLATKRSIESDSDATGDDVMTKRRCCAPPLLSDIVRQLHERIVTNLSARPVFTVSVTDIGFRLTDMTIQPMAHDAVERDLPSSFIYEANWINLLVRDTEYNASISLAKFGERISVASLTELRFERVDYSDVPEDLFSLPNLKSLAFDACENVELPQRISELQSLVCLHIAYRCPGRSIQWCSALTSLEILGVYWTGVDDISFIRYMTALKDLWLGKCRISRATEICHLTRLERLSLSCNPLRQFPWQICMSCTKLRELRVYSAELTTLPPEIGRLLECGLELLDIDDNPLQLLPAQLYHTVSRCKIRCLINCKETDISFINTGGLITLTHWPENTYMCNIPREVQMVLWYYVAPPVVPKPR